MKKRIFFTFLFLSIYLTATFAQGNFRRGFIITNEGDTVSGWIDFRTDARNMQVCDFRETETGATRSFLPGQIFGFRFYEEGKFHVSREIMISGIPRTVFLEFILQGNKNLFYYIDTVPFENVEYYFFEDATGRMIPVTRKPDEHITSSQRRQDLRYRGVIRYIFQEHESIAQQTDNLKFNHQSMIDIARQYHDLTCPIGEECIIFETKEDKNINIYQFSVYSGTFTIFERGNSLRLAPVIGGRLNIFSPRYDNNLSYIVDLGIIPTLIDNFIYFHVQLGARYAFLDGNTVRPVLGGGLLFLSGFVPVLYGTVGMDFYINDRQAIFVDIDLVSFFGLQLKAGFRF